MSESDNPAAPTYAVLCRVDVGKAEHHACALDPSGAKLHNKALPNDEAALTAVLSGLTAHGRVLVVIDQPASIGAHDRGGPQPQHRRGVPARAGDAADR